MNGSGLVDHVKRSPNVEARFEGQKPTLIILHYTGMKDAETSVGWLCNPESKVSCHYLVDVDGTVVQMVDEDMRAWHAGVSSWQGEIDINSRSIGIEIQNTGHSGGSPPFPGVQMQRVAALCLDISQRWNLPPEATLAHSDVAPGRKIDPGEVFDWVFLFERGVGAGARPSANPHSQGSLKPGEAGPSVKALQADLARFGYGVEANGDFNDGTRIVVEAFQRHFRPARVNGEMDAECLDVLRRLLETAFRTTGDRVS